MYKINELKKLLPFNIDNIKLELLTYSDIDWYIEIVKQDFFNKYIDNRFTDTSKEYLRFKLFNLAMSYKTGVKVQGEARLIIKDAVTNERIGGCTLFEVEDNTIEIGYWIIPAFQNKGIAKKLIYNIKDLVFRLSKIDTIKLTIREDNIVSIIIAEKCGYKKMGDFLGKYKKNLVYGVMLYDKN